MVKTVRIDANFPEKARDALERLSEATGFSKSQVLRDAVMNLYEHSLLSSSGYELVRRRVDGPRQATILKIIGYENLDLE